MSREPGEHRPNLAADVRVLGSHVASAITDYGAYRWSSGITHDAAIEVARLTAGLDPEMSNRESLDYAFGASEALTAVLVSFRDRQLDPDVEELLKTGHNFEILTFVAENPGKGVTLSSVIDSRHLTRGLSSLYECRLIEPSPPIDGSKRAWSLTRSGLGTIAGIKAERSEQELRDKIEKAHEEGLRIAFPSGEEAG